jgi:hypothetical protein
MNMRIMEAFRQAGSAFRATLGGQYEEDLRRKIRGDVFFTMRDGKTQEVQLQREVHNVVTLDASILLARLVKDNDEPPFGAYVLAVGSGDVGWAPMNPPAADDEQRALYSEITRKVFSSTEFINAGGVPVAYPTHIVDFTTTYTESEAVGPLVEMGIIGGNISTNMATKNPVSPPHGVYDPTVDLTAYETLLNYLTFPVINKPATSTLSITWRLTF